MAYDDPKDVSSIDWHQVRSGGIDVSVRATNGRVSEDVLRKRAAALLLSGLVEPSIISMLRQ